VEYDVEFIASFEARVGQTIKEYGLLENGEKILVAVSGGKDSTALLSILCKQGYEVEAVTVDAKIGCYSAENYERIDKYCRELGVKLHTINFRDEFGGSLCYLQDVLKGKGVDLKSCTTCGVLRRHLISVKAKELGAEKLVMGHNMDDEVQVLMMNLMKGHIEKCASMGPMTGKKHNTLFVPRVKPFYFTSEKDIVKYVTMLELPAKLAVCPCASGGMRYVLRDALAEYGEEHGDFKENVMGWYVKMLARLRGVDFGTTYRFCGSCDEPSASEICRTCQIVSVLKVEHGK
tara:strand:+ start:77 stop:946 length:870 start_codon:yes stop_codon:yes gene_type:complete